MSATEAGWCSTTPPTMLFPIGRNLIVLPLSEVGEAATSVGPYLYWKDGSLVRDTTKGPGGSHGEQREYSMNGRNAEHPVVRGLPAVDTCDRRAVRSDARSGQCRGIAVHGLCRSRTRRFRTRGTVGFYRRLRESRIFHLMIGHAGPSLEDNPAMQCTGFQTLLLRGSEWAATGKVRQRVPDDFPTERKSSLRKDYRKP